MSIRCLPSFLLGMGRGLQAKQQQEYEALQQRGAKVRRPGGRRPGGGGRCVVTMPMMGKCNGVVLPGQGSTPLVAAAAAGQAGQPGCGARSPAAGRGGSVCADGACCFCFWCFKRQRCTHCNAPRTARACTFSVLAMPTYSAQAWAVNDVGMRRVCPKLPCLSKRVHPGCLTARLPAPPPSLSTRAVTSWSSSGWLKLSGAR